MLLPAEGHVHAGTSEFKQLTLKFKKEEWNIYITNNDVTVTNRGGQLLNIFVIEKRSVVMCAHFVLRNSIYVH